MVTAQADESPVVERMGRVKWLSVIGFLAPLFYVYPLFLGSESGRFYALTPVSSLLPVLPLSIEYLLLAALVLALVSILFVRHCASLICLAVFLFSFSVLFDQSRLMPYFYEFCALLLAVAFAFHGSSAGERAPLRAVQAVLVSIWFWSGLHKFSLRYLFVGYPWMVRPLVERFPFAAPVLEHGAIVTAIVEAGCAVLVLFPRLRLIGLLGVTGMHLSILMIFGPLGQDWNPSVWSWNIVQIGLAWTAFWRTRERPSEIFPFQRALNFGSLSAAAKYHLAAASLFFLCPIFNLFGMWDDFLSHALYSWTTMEGEVRIASEVTGALPEEVKPYLTVHQGETLLPILNWSFGLFESPPYHSRRVYRTLFAKLCDYTSKSLGHVPTADELRLRIFLRPPPWSFRSEREELSCSSAEGPASSPPK